MPGKNIVYYIQVAPPLIDAPDFASIFEHVLTNDSISTVVLTAYWRKHIKKVKDPKAFEDRLRQTLQRLVAAGKKVYLTDDIPDFPFTPSSLPSEGQQTPLSRRLHNG